VWTESVKSRPSFTSSTSSSSIIVVRSSIACRLRSASPASKSDTLTVGIWPGVSVSFDAKAEGLKAGIASTTITFDQLTFSNSVTTVFKFSGGSFAVGSNFTHFAFPLSTLTLNTGSLNDLIARRLEGGTDPEESSLAREGRKRTQKVPELVRQAGFRNLKTSWSGAEVLIDTPEEFWDLQRTFSSFARKRLSDADAGQLESVRAEFLKICREVQARGGKLIYPYGALYVLAQRPLV